MSDTPDVATLVGATVALAKKVDALVIAHAHSKRVVRLLAASIVFDLFLSFGFFFSLHRTQEVGRVNRHLITQIEKVRAESDHADCAAANVLANGEQVLWESAWSVRGVLTPEEIARQARFFELLTKLFPLQDCG